MQSQGSLTEGGKVCSSRREGRSKELGCQGHKPRSMSIARKKRKETESTPTPGNLLTPPLLTSSCEAMNLCCFKLPRSW